MKEKTLRYPGHIDKIAVLRESGFFDKKEIDFGGVKISPLEFTSKILFSKWGLMANDRDITIMKVIVEGNKNNNRIRYTYDLFDQYDESTKTHSMARTTGYTATIILRMIAKKMFLKKGISAPEIIGKDSLCVKYVIEELNKRGINVIEKIDYL